MDLFETYPPESTPAISAAEFEAVRIQLAREFSKYRLSLNDEAYLQGQIATVLDKAGVPYQREYRASRGERPDFLLTETRIALEIKVRGSADVHLRQMRRYNALPNINGTILICPRPAEVPSELGGKPAGSISLYRRLL